MKDDTVGGIFFSYRTELLCHSLPEVVCAKSIFAVMGWGMGVG